MSYIKSSKILGRFGGDLFMFQKAIIIGCPGAGKSTFARKLSDKMYLPCIILICYGTSLTGQLLTEIYLMRN